MGRLMALSLNTFRELIREKYFLVILFVGAIFLMLSFFVGELSFAEQEKILADVGFFVIHMTCVGVALLTGSVLISREVEKQTCLLTLSRPVSRSQFLLGKLLGVAWLITFVVVALTIGIQIIMWGWKNWYGYILVAYSLWFESIILLFLVLAASVLVRPVLAFLFGLMVMLLGHWITDLEFFAAKNNQGTYKQLLQIVRWIIPNFDRFNWKSFIYLQNPPTTESVIWLTGHGLAWLVVYFIFARFLFGRKDIV